MWCFSCESKMPTYSMEQVAEHKNEQSAWFVINNKVYDVTRLVNEVSF